MGHIRHLLFLFLFLACSPAVQHRDQALPALPEPEYSLALEAHDDGELKGFCSASAIGNNLLLTAAHCADHAATVWTRSLYARGAGGYDVTWIYTDPSSDIAVGRVGGAPFGSFVPIRCTLPKSGDFLQLIHHGRRDYWRYDAGQYLGVESSLQVGGDELSGVLVMASFRALPGTSGAGVLDAEGRLIGAVSAATPAGDAQLVIVSSVRNVEAFCASK